MSDRRGSTAGAALATLGLTYVARELSLRAREEDLTGQVVLITGGSRGLGYLLAQEFARQGCKIAICARSEPELERARKDLEAGGAEVLAVPCDVTDRSQVERFVSDTTRRFGQVDIVVNNASIIQVGPAPTMTLQHYEDAMNVNYWATVYTTLAVLPQMLERKSGRIVNIVSIGGRVAVPHLLPYISAKFGVQGFSEGLRAELARYGIKVTTIDPGLMRTGSFINVFLTGKQKYEYTMFALAASLPLVTMNASRAARQIVSATKRGSAVTSLGLQWNMVGRFHGLFPGTTANMLGVVNRILPGADGAGSDTELSRKVEGRMQSRLLRAATSLGHAAARRNLQHPVGARDEA